MKALISIVFLIQVENFIVLAANNEITWSDCSGPFDLTFVCGKKNAVTAGSVDNIKDSDVPSFEKFKVENQLAENAPKNDGDNENSEPAEAQAAQEVNEKTSEGAENNGEKKEVTETPKEAIETPKEVTETPNKVPQAVENTAETPTEQHDEVPTKKPNEDKQQLETETAKTQTSEEKPAQPISEVKPESNGENKTESYAQKPEPEVKNESATTNQFTGKNADDSNALEKCFNGDSMVSRPKSTFISISYRDCKFDRLPAASNAFSAYESLELFDISNVGLEKLDVIQGANLLETIIASHNNLTEISAGLFSNMPRLAVLDLSNNSISNIDLHAFVPLRKLEKLKLRSNKLTNVNPSIFANLTNLVHLDLSQNQFNSFDSQLFGQLSNLTFLNVSYNSIEKLDISIFSALEQLKHLDLSHLKLTEFEGNLSHLIKLKSLNLAHNKLKNIKLEQFSVLKNLENINLNGNELTDLSGFNRSHFPNLVTFGITGNNFNCTYLETFFNSTELKSIDFTSGLKIPCDQNVREVSCNKPAGSMEEYFEAKLHSIVKHVENTVSTMKASISILCIAMVILVIFIIILRRKVQKATGRSAIYELSEGPDGRKEGKAVICT